MDYLKTLELKNMIIEIKFFKLSIRVLMNEFNLIKGKINEL